MFVYELLLTSVDTRISELCRSCGLNEEWGDEGEVGEVGEKSADLGGDLICLGA